MKLHLKAVVEIFTIMLLLYANVLMGFFTVDKDFSIAEALLQLLTWPLFFIAFSAALIAYHLLEWIRKG